LLRPAIDALAITAIPQAATAVLSISATAVRMTPPMPRDPPRYPRLVRRDRKKQFMPVGQPADWGKGRQRRPAHGLVNANSCPWFHCLRSSRQRRAGREATQPSNLARVKADCHFRAAPRLKSPRRVAWPLPQWSRRRRVAPWHESRWFGSSIRACGRAPTPTPIGYGSGEDILATRAMRGQSSCRLWK